jgi:molybdopterin adenylyltransferase
MIRVGILTVSDSCARGKRDDLSGRSIEQMLDGDRYEVGGRRIVADNLEAIAGELVRLSDGDSLDLVLTTGGTGLGPRDVTPEATISVCERLVPGFGEAMRVKGLEKSPNSILSRAVAGIRGNTLIVNLPGSPRAVRECLELIVDVLPHAIDMMHGGGH